MQRDAKWLPSWDCHCHKQRNAVRHSSLHLPTLGGDLRHRGPTWALGRRGAGCPGARAGHRHHKLDTVRVSHIVITAQRVAVASAHWQARLTPEMLIV